MPDKIRSNNNNHSLWRRPMMGLTLGLLVLWVVLSIFAACKGADWAKPFFNSPPLAALWLALTLLLTAGLLIYPSLRKNAGLMLIHAGCIFLICGAMWGSSHGHTLQKYLLGSEKITTGYMLIPEGQSEHQIYDAGFQHQLADLPFELYLHDFAIDYYWDRGQLIVNQPNAKPIAVPARPGETASLSPPYASVAILKQFKNFKISMGKTDKAPYDDPQSGVNPALEIELTRQGGAKEKKFIFERFGDFNPQNTDLALRYTIMPRDYLSDLEARRDGQTLARKTIEVNHPMHCGGYYFYQADYDHDQGQYTILSVSSDSGRGAVFVGGLLLMIGLCARCWRRLKPADSPAPDAPLAPNPDKTPNAKLTLPPDETLNSIETPQ